VVIAHGSSSRVAIENAITLAAESAEHHVPAEIEKRLAATSSVV
jgi:fatty acid/phospholipid biosynthesis enzyme